MSMDLFDPTIAPDKTTIHYAQRPQRMDGLKIGLVDNTKFNSKILLLKIADRLNKKYGTQMIHLVSKTSSGHPVSDSAIREFKNKADVVIAGIGD